MKTAKTTKTKMNIFLPKHLRIQMNKLTKPINWSAVACGAFEREVAKSTKRKDVKASKRSMASEYDPAGRADGQTWARHSAKVAELKRLEPYLRQTFYTPKKEAYGPGQSFFFTIAPDVRGDRAAAQDFWERRLGDDVSRSWDRTYVDGFVAGALDVWDEVSGKS